MEALHFIVNKIAALLEPNLVKVVTAATIALFSFFFGDVYTEGLIAVVMLMIIDTVLGVAASYYEGKPITSKRFSRALLKGIVYLTSISAAYYADLTIPLDLVQSTMIAFVGSTEFISILENVGRLGYKTPKKLLNQLTDKYVN